MTFEQTPAVLAAAGIVSIAALVGGSVAGLPALAASLPGAVTAGLLAVLVVAVVVTGVTGAEKHRRTPYW
jgi:hypothetical protein